MLLPAAVAIAIVVHTDAESEGCFTLTDLYNFRGTENDGSSKGPLYMLDGSGSKITAPTSVTKKWLLEAELYVTNGAIFYCIGSEEGGDCDELRIQSTGPDDWYEVRGHGGSMYFSHTVVTSWDTPNKQPQETYEGGRSFLNCVSEKLTGETCDGMAKNDMGECRMDIINSEMGYMGFFDSESYGLTWKVRRQAGRGVVRGFCKDLSNPDVFETTNVYGDIKNSDIHHMYYGHYSYGHQGGVWTNNEMHDNHQYVANNKVYNNYNHGIIASKRCNNVKIYDNQVSDGGPDAVGIFLHRSSDNAEVYGNKIWNMPDAGIALLESFNADIHDNEIDGVQFGIRMSLGSGGNSVYDNEFNDCSDWGLYTYMGSDEPDVSNGRPNGNTFNNNKVTNSAGGVKFKNSDNIVVTNNEFTGTEELEFYDAQATTWSGNSLPSGVCIDNITSDDGNSVPPSTFSSSSGVPSEEC
ncbi:MEP1 [Ectocarpus sp. CCAP 1310/34]|nr:MEP1 [Ectocarpus sp. CCAP 1310/34]